LEPHGDKIVAIQMKSKHAAELFGPEAFNFVFIDANHGYEFVKEDILAWWPKLKKGGLMCGDDYQNKPTHGVIRAVDELLPRRNIIGPIWYVNKVTLELL
jgi:predicted O-methyltransferase YrrM